MRFEPSHLHSSRGQKTLTFPFGKQNSIRSYRQWFDKWDVTKYNCKKRQQRRRMLQQCIKQEEACDDRRSNSPALDSSPRLPYPKALSVATTASQDELTGESKTPDQVAEAAAAARLPQPKVVEVSQNRDDVSPREGYSPWYNKPSSHRQWTATTKPFNHRKRQLRRKLPQQQQQQQIIKQEAYTGLQSPPLDARLPHTRPIDTQDPLPTSERKPQDLMAGGAAGPPSPKADENHFVLSPPAEAPWARNRSQEGAYVPHIPR